MTAMLIVIAVTWLAMGAAWALLAWTARVDDELGRIEEEQTRRERGWRW